MPFSYGKCIVKVPPEICSLSFAHDWMTYFRVGITYFFPCCTVFLYVVHNTSLRNTYFEHRTLNSSETHIFMSEAHIFMSESHILMGIT